MVIMIIVSLCVTSMNRIFSSTCESLPNQVFTTTGAKAFSRTENPDSEVVDLDFAPFPNNSIHFIITSARSLAPKTREACGLESAARLNPNTTVVLHINSARLYMSRMVKNLLAQYKNIICTRFDIYEVIRGTPYDGWYNSSGIEHSRMKLTYLSDLGRMALLYKYGGWYLDIDILSLKSLEDKNFTNAVGIFAKEHRPTTGDSSFLKFQQGHTFLKELMELVIER